MQNALKDIFCPMFEAMLKGEMNDHLGYSSNDHGAKKTTNRRNGYSGKSIKTSVGEIDILVPRDKYSSFEPKIIPKHKKDVSTIENKVLSMYAKGMTINDISAHIEDIYGLEVSDSLVSRITDENLSVVKEWQQRPLESIYAVVFMDAIHYNVRCEGRIVKKAVYIAIGINMDGRKKFSVCM